MAVAVALFAAKESSAASKCEERKVDYCKLKDCSDEDEKKDGNPEGCKCVQAKGTTWCQDKNCVYYEAKTKADRKDEKCVDDKKTDGPAAAKKDADKKDTLGAAVPRAPSLLLVAATMAAAGMHAFM